jgi:hypothetical protein
MRVARLMIERVDCRCKSPTFFLGATDCLDILLLLRLPVYQAARTLHRTGDTHAHSSAVQTECNLF